MDAIQGKEVILSLYEPEDVDNKKDIAWDQYLLPATVWTADNAYTEFLGLQSGMKYFYAFTTQFPDHGLDMSKVLSYQDYLKQC